MHIYCSSCEKFQEFHRQYYHPSNARIWFYGDDDPVHRLRVLSGKEPYLKLYFLLGHFLFLIYVRHYVIVLQILSLFY